MVFELTSYNPNANPQHPMKGSDAFLVVEYSAHVKSPPNPRLHRSPIIKEQKVNFHISSEEFNEILATGAKGNAFDGTVKMFVTIDGIEAMSTVEVKSGWDKRIYVISSYGIKCDNASHEIEVRLEQFVQDQLWQQWPEKLTRTHRLKFDKSLAKKKKEIKWFERW